MPRAVFDHEVLIPMDLSWRSLLFCNLTLIFESGFIMSHNTEIGIVGIWMVLLQKQSFDSKSRKAPHLAMSQNILICLCLISLALTLFVAMVTKWPSYHSKRFPEICYPPQHANTPVSNYNLFGPFSIFINVCFQNITVFWKIRLQKGD